MILKEMCIVQKAGGQGWRRDQEKHNINIDIFIKIDIIPEFLRSYLVKKSIIISPEAKIPGKLFSVVFVHHNSEV